MKIVWKALVGVALAAALFCIARVMLYGVGSLPFMNSFSTPQTNAGSEAKPSGTAPDYRASSQPNPSAEPPRSPQPASSPGSGQGGGQTSTVPNPPSMYERARRAGNRPNNAQDE